MERIGDDLEDTEEDPITLRAKDSAISLLEMLDRLVRDCDGTTLGTVKAPRFDLAAEATALVHFIKTGQ